MLWLIVSILNLISAAWALYDHDPHNAYQYGMIAMLSFLLAMENKK